jgi:23S rRNA-/tRNA-specific pseudouridylate synthase
VAARSRAALSRFTRAFAAGEIRRLYTARVRGRIPAGDGWLDLELPLRAISGRPRRFEVAADGVPAHTRLRVESAGDVGTRVRLEAVTGRQHQLRVHLAHLGHPIAGDRLYDPDRAAREPLALVADELHIPAGVALLDRPLIVGLPARAGAAGDL